MNYHFAKHETFHIRTGWLRKGLNALEKNDHILLEKIEPMDELGIGSNMIKALRYWMQTVNLTEEKYNSNREKVQEKTNLAMLLEELDPYFEDTATFWILHYFLCKKEELATTWYWFFNYFNYQEFNKELFIEKLIKFIEITGGKVPAKSSLTKDYNVLTRMYLYDPTEHISPEDSLESPFKDLKLIKETDDFYKINTPDLNILPADIFMYCLLDSIGNKSSINVEDLINKEKSVGKIFKFDINTLYKYIEKLESENYLKLNRHAGLNSVEIIKNNQTDILTNYYKSLNTLV